MSRHFGRAKYFLIAELESGLKKVLENPHSREGRDERGHGLILKLLRSEGVNKVLCYNVGARMLEDLQAVGIDVEFVDEISISELLKSLRSDHPL